MMPPGNGPAVWRLHHVAEVLSLKTCVSLCHWSQFRLRYSAIQEPSWVLVLFKI